MKTAIIASKRLIDIKIDDYLPRGLTLVVSGGASDIDILAERYADKNGIPKLVFYAEYGKYGIKAPFERNKLIVQNADNLIAFWDGKSFDTLFAAIYAKSIGKKSVIYLL